ncbi:hypothetical protein K469DRAFT_292742 [Zopfia rhizophila CBS 207.26]|uniref:DUF7708 domain-containing protein n=1 Tax=Zopfia rhizophila CBS 207.26 TaxID=1314779 RepID=A0A6A6DNN1_9PEZI|nr:hypothetical protein K469DRAFT_292742 [Zopfia rhizophila CBS 207.26]
MQDRYTIEDLHQVVIEVKSKYKKRSEQGKARKWLTRFSSRVMFYGNIVDTLCQHHQEFVSLAWGTFKLLFVVGQRNPLVLQVSQLSKAMCKSPRCFPRAELKVITYAIDDMKRFVESLLASIIKFFDRAIKWY